MGGFLTFVEFLVAIGVVVSAISSYLIVNKLWKRRHMKDVAESISISAAFLGLFTSVPLLIQFAMINQTPLPAMKTVISIATGIVFVLVGTGLWVSEYRDLGFLTLLRRALKLERSESTELIKAMIRPQGADRIVHILEQMAAIDHEVDPREVELIKEFAHRWRVPMPEIAAGAVDQADILHLRESVTSYLDTTPPTEQAAQLLDVLRLFVRADERVSREEELMMEEIGGLISVYASDDDTPLDIYEVLIVPQTDEQIDAVHSLIPGIEMKERRGGRVFSAGEFYSRRYAELVCERYIALGLFTTQVSR